MHLQVRRRKLLSRSTGIPSLECLKRRSPRLRLYQIFFQISPPIVLEYLLFFGGLRLAWLTVFFVAGPFIKLGPLRMTDAAEVAGCLSGAGLVLILTACLSIYGATAFQRDDIVGVKTLSGRSVTRDPLQSSEGWASFTSGWLVGGLSGVAWCYILTQVLPYYS